MSFNIDFEGDTFCGDSLKILELWHRPKKSNVELAIDAWILEMSRSNSRHTQQEINNRFRKHLKALGYTKNITVFVKKQARVKRWAYFAYEIALETMDLGLGKISEIHRRQRRIRLGLE